MARRHGTQRPDSEDDLSRMVSRHRSFRMEAHRCYRPATTAQLSVHQSTYHEIIVRGGKRAAKSTCGFAEFARRVTGRPIMANLAAPTWRPTGGDVELHSPFPVSTTEDARLYWVIGWDLKHIGQTVYRLLFEPGLFRIIRDVDTNEWRTFNPACPEDAVRKHESCPAEPLIPSNLIEEESWSWDTSAGGKSGNVFREVKLKNGAKICSYPSSAKAPKQGDPVDGLLIDEDIQFPEYLDEYQDRLTDRDGWMIWTVWPHVANNALVNVLKRAEDELDYDKSERTIEAVQLLMSDNPFITDDAKQRSFRRMGDDDSIARRDRGDLLLDTLAMYDFVPGIHVLDAPGVTRYSTSPKGTKREMLQSIYDKDRCFPEDWTRYLAVDPSHTRTAVLFGVVPPPEVAGVMMGRCVIIENEIILKKATADTLAIEIREAIKTKRYEAFIMDRRMGRQTRVGSDVNVFQIYSEAFRKHKVTSRVTEHSFIPGCDKPTIRYAAVRSFLQGRDGWPDVYFAGDKAIHTQKEFASYRKKQQLVGGESVLMDEPSNPRKYDAMAAMEYMLAYLEQAFTGGTAYVPPYVYTGGGSDAYRLARAMLRSQSLPGRDFVHLGPGQGHAA